jgi:hypothetical protein
MFDIVIPCHPKDYEMLELCINGIRTNVSDFRNIYIVSPHEIKLDGVIHVSESRYPFSRQGVFERLNVPNKADIVHWYLQQLLKMHIWDVVPDILDTVLVVDSELVFLKPHTFFEDKKPIFSFGEQPSDRKFIKHMNKLHEKFVETKEYTGVVDYEIWDKYVWVDIRSLVEKKHNKKFWEAYIDCAADPESSQNAAEYELYYQFYSKPHVLTHKKTTITNRVSDLQKLKDEGYDNVTFHRWIGARI